MGLFPGYACFACQWGLPRISLSVYIHGGCRLIFSHVYLCEWSVYILLHAYPYSPIFARCTLSEVGTTVLFLLLLSTFSTYRAPSIASPAPRFVHFGDYFDFLLCLIWSLVIVSSVRSPAPSSCGAPSRTYREYSHVASMSKYK